MIQRIYTLLAVFGLIVLTGAPFSVTAQSHSPSEDSSATYGQWKPHFGTQVRTLLESPNPEVQDNGMQLILHYAQRDADIDFAPAVPALFDVYDHAEHEGRRLLALRAIDAVGTEAHMRRLAQRLDTELSDRVRAHTLRTLASRNPNE
jgi:hypothetical protein